MTVPCLFVPANFPFWCRHLPILVSYLSHFALCKWANVSYFPVPKMCRHLPIFRAPIDQPVGDFRPRRLASHPFASYRERGRVVAQAANRLEQAGEGPLTCSSWLAPYLVDDRFASSPWLRAYRGCW